MTKQQQVNAILAGIRLLQNHLDPIPGEDLISVEDILTNDGQDATPTMDELNELCEEIADIIFDGARHG
jgi:hypothetical protein